MLSSLIAVFALASSTLPETPPTAAIEVGIDIGATGFSARNYTAQHRLLVFRESERTLWRVLPAGGELAWSFPRHVLGDIELEVVTQDRAARLHTGALLLGDLVAQRIGRLWVEAGPVVWAEAGTELRLGTLDAGSSTLEFTTPTGVEHRTDIGPTHVPVITPSDTPQGDLPPKLEEKPLPPI